MLSYEEVVKGMTKQFSKYAPVGATFRPKFMLVKEPKVRKDIRLASGIITSTTPDMEREVIITSGLDTSYLEKFQTVYLGHNYDQPVGSMRRIRRVPTPENPTGIWASAYVSETALGQDVLTMLEEQVIKGTSIGMASMPGDFAQATDKDQNMYGECDTVHQKGRVYEYSFTSMPCNTDAVISEVVVKSLDEMLRKNKILRSSAVMAGLPTTPQRKFFPTREVPIVAFDGTVMVPIRSRA